MITVVGHTFDETILGKGVIIDVGCRGFEFADHFRGAHVYCIDPDSEVFKERLLEGIIPFDRPVFFTATGNYYTYMNVAISDKSGETTYYRNGEATMIRALDPDPTFIHIDQKYCNTCKTITMDDLYKITGEDVEILKLDCEGGEYLILNDNFRPVPKQITVEFHNHCVPETHAKHYTAIIERLSEHYTMASGVWEQRHGCGFNWWDSLFIRKDLIK